MTKESTKSILPKGIIINSTYEINFFIGEGAFGEVYRVKHKFFDEFQVMKVFKDEYVKKTNLDDVIHEGRILTKLSHPNVVKVYEINTFNYENKDYYFITMSFVSGESLSQLSKRKIQLDVPVATSVMVDVLHGLGAAHQNTPAIIHRDINLDNILLSYDSYQPTGILGDFGISKFFDQLTKISGAGGRFLYFAPECFLDVYLPVSDVFSTGVVLYKILTGTHPWEYESIDGDIDDNTKLAFMMNKARKDRPKKPSLFNYDIDNKLENVIMKSLEKKMENRFSTSDNFLKELQDACKIDELHQKYWIDQNLISTN